MADIIQFPLAYYPSIEAAQEDVDNAQAQFHAASEQFHENCITVEYYRHSRERLFLARDIKRSLQMDKLIGRGRI